MGRPRRDRRERHADPRAGAPAAERSPRPPAGRRRIARPCGPPAGDKKARDRWPARRRPVERRGARQARRSRR
ncbi:MAG: hypothetical protein D6731_01990 [Planctomycetota bacterium]|nr:MAG: hypothetical protein D6731_01990 [Planctomycetota bacterium]